MAEGSSQYKGMAVPLVGNSEIKGSGDTYDVVTITGYSTNQTGDFLVCQSSAGSEVFVVDVNGNVTAAGTLAVTGASTHTGNMTVSGTLAVTGASTHTGNMTASGTLAVTGASTLTGDVTASGNVNITGRVAKQLGLGTIALASLASNASGTVALSGLNTKMVVQIYQTSNVTLPMPVVWASDTDKLGYGAPSVDAPADTYVYWMFQTTA